MSAVDIIKKRSYKITHMQIYTATVSAVGLILLAWATIYSLQYFPLLFIFILLIILAELTTSESFFSEISFSISSAVSFASLLVFGPLPAGLVAAIGGLVTTLVSDYTRLRENKPRSKSPLVERVFFNMSVLGLSATLAGVVYLYLGGSLQNIANWSNFMPMLFAALVAELLNAWLVVIVVWLQTKQSPLQIYRQSFLWLMPINVGSMLLGGAGLAIGYEVANLLGLIIFTLPIMLTIYAFRLYVQQTKSQMDKLEEIIEERTGELRKAYDDLKRTDRVKTTFFSVVNHEMRTPLTAIVGYADLLTLDKTLSDRNRDMIQAIEMSSNRLMDLVNNILDISRLEEGKLKIYAIALQLQPIITEVLTMVRPMMEMKSIRCDIHAEDDLPQIYGDPKRISQILTNLINNAIKYTPRQGHIAITAWKQTEPDMVCVSITDTGMGIPPDKLPTIFDRFSRIENEETQKTVGTGLGLSITKGLVEAHGGTITVDSEENHGSCFTFTLPVVMDVNTHS